MNKISGIYRIINIVTGDFYIGQAVNFKRRKNAHFNELKRGKHHSSYLQNAYNKYGEENFKFEIVLYCENFELTRYEQGLVDRLKPVYNMEILCVTSRLGVTHSEETRKKISEAGKGRFFSEESRKKKSDAMKGKTQTEEHRKKSADARRGKKLSEQARRNVILGHDKRINKQPTLGYKHTEETKRKISLGVSGSLNGMYDNGVSGSMNSNWGKIGMSGSSNPMYGIHLIVSEETRQKISISLKGKPKPPRSKEHGKKLGESHKGKKYKKSDKGD